MKIILSAVMMILGVSVASATVAPDIITRAKTNAERAMAIADAAWDKGAINRFGGNATDNDLAMADYIDCESADRGGTSDVWPLTAAIEAHNSILEAINSISAADENQINWANEQRTKYMSRLKSLIDNLEWYRGEYSLASYAVTTKKVSPYAVPRASARGTANVSGILNVYDDQMWIARELIRAYRLTDNRDYLNRAVYLTDYVLEGWDCWRDTDGDEYGGITWGPGYNSKHACSNAPIIQPLTWLSEIYAELETNDLLTESEKSFKSYSRDASNKVVVDKTTPRSDHYLEFAKKIYDWQKSKLLDKSKNVYYDMMGADGTIKVSGGYRNHVDTGGAVGAYYSYNTGTMISGAASLYEITEDESYIDDLTNAVRGSYIQFTRSVRSKNTYEFITDESAMNGFNTWFNCVLIRSYVDALPYCTNRYANEGLTYMQKNLDYAYDNPEYNKGNLLPIRLLDGWKNETRTKPFHQFAYASEYGVMAKSLINSNNDDSAVTEIDEETQRDDTVYTLTGIKLGSYSEIKINLPSGLYIIGGKKILHN